MRYVLPFLGKGGGGLPAPTSWTFTSSNNYSSAGTPTQAKLSDSDSYTFWANMSEPNGFLQADFGDVKTLKEVRYRAAPPDATGGWGVEYTDGSLIQYSTNGSTWTDILTISGSSTTVTTLYTLPVPVVARYVRFFNAPSAYTALSEFYFG